MTPDVKADATQAARQGLEDMAAYCEGTFDLGRYVNGRMCAAHIRIILAALSTAERERDAALALAGERLEALNDIREQADLGAASCSSLYRYAGEMNVETIDRDMMSNMLGEQFLVIRSRAAVLQPPQQQQHDNDHDHQP